MAFVAAATGSTTATFTNANVWQAWNLTSITGTSANYFHSAAATTMTFTPTWGSMEHRLRGNP